MQLFSEETELEMRQMIIELVEQSVQTLHTRDDTRYLRQYELINYAGGVSKDTIRKWVTGKCGSITIIKSVAH
jgi:hypothetical protein